MPVMDGLTAAKHIRTLDNRPILVFYTNHAKYAINGYEVDAFDFWIKPLSYSAFSEKMKKAVAKCETLSLDYIVVKIDDGFINLPIYAIKYVEKEGHDLLYHTEFGEYRYRGSVAEAEEKLLSYDFVRCNRGCIVNIRAVTRMDKDGLHVGKECLSVSRGMYRSVKDKLISCTNGY